MHELIVGSRIAIAVVLALLQVQVMSVSELHELRQARLSAAVPAILPECAAAAGPG